MAPAPTISAAVYTPADRPLLQNVQYIWGGRNYCWYDDAWNGPGYYWCGYAYRRGFGFGGILGWHGWGRGGDGLAKAPGGAEPGRSDSRLIGGFIGSSPLQARLDSRGPRLHGRIPRERDAVI